MESPLPADPYVALGLPKDCTAIDIKKKYRQLALKHHPDKVADPQAKEEASNLFSAIAGAYEILSDETRRGRYDAAVKLAELRREAMESRGAARAEKDPSSPYKDSTSRPSYTSRGSERATPQYQTEERRPSYAKGDYFDRPPRATTRKEPEYERVSRRATHDSKEKSSRAAKEAKENEKERRRDKTRRTERDTRRDRDRKYASYAEASDSDSDELSRWQRKMREEDDQRRAKEEERRAAKDYHDKAYRQQQEADDGAYADERTRKMFAASAQARDYIQSSRTRPRGDSERRPSPQRASSSNKYEYVKSRDGRPSVVRRGSQRPKTTGRDTESSRKSTREPERRSSAEKMDEARRPPTLNQTKSSPADIHIPTTDKQRSQSLQTEAEPVRDMPQFKRAETMPHGGLRRENTAPTKGSGLRQTEFNEGLATPATTPEYNGPSNGGVKYPYGRQYADDVEYPTPDGYKTEVREPHGEQSRSSRPTIARRFTRSPSPVKLARESRDRDSGDDRERVRSSSARYPTSPQPPPLNTRTTSYVYGGPGQGVEAYDRSRPNSGRGTSPRDAPYLYGEVRGEVRPDSHSPRQKYGPYPPPDEGVRYGRGIRPEDIKFQTGSYSYKRSNSDRPTMSRQASGNPTYATAKG